ncbi:uncharacterized protein ARMOST_14480 [Armillaria ostoyae]|uniref:Uncharacterized protein n=1 Tax=Armillaria ostoyae TaxID=47428 RepID=A0A284RQM8_ARMOS|nr:uncharacterized protein ARMOST_14480 [Armillaria ostoyae]
MDEAATRQGWVGPSHSLTFSSTHANLSSHSHLRMSSSAAINDDCLCSVVLRCAFLQDKRHEELDRTARYGEDDAGWRNGLDVALAFGWPFPAVFSAKTSQVASHSDSCSNS